MPRDAARVRNPVIKNSRLIMSTTIQAGTFNAGCSTNPTSAAAIKTALIARDPYEHDLRRPLNFGHTIGHPLETVTGYGPLHQGSDGAGFIDHRHPMMPMSYR